MRARITDAARARHCPDKCGRRRKALGCILSGRKQAWPLGVALPGRNAQAVLTAPGRAAQECACLRLLEDDGAGRQALEVEQTVEFAFLHMHKTLRTRLAVTLVRRRPPPAPRTPLTAPGRCCTSLLVRGHACGAASLPAPRAQAARVAAKMHACRKVQPRHRTLWGDSVRPLGPRARLWGRLPPCSARASCSRCCKDACVREGAGASQGSLGRLRALPCRRLSPTACALAQDRPAGSMAFRLAAPGVLRRFEGRWRLLPAAAGSCQLLIEQEVRTPCRAAPECDL